MTYVVAADLIARYGEPDYVQLTDRDRDGQPDELVVEGACVAATAEIDGYLARRYPVPLAMIPERIKLAATVIAWFHLHVQGLGSDAPERLAYLDQVKWLQAVAAGTADVPGLAVTVAAPSAGAVFVGPDRTFSRAGLREF